MDRRTFTLGLGAVAVSLSLGGCARFLQQGCDTAPCSPKLRAQLEDLADPFFNEYAQSFSSHTLYTTLEQSGVVSERDGIHFEKLQTLAREEPIITYQGFYFTQTELDLYALANLISGA